MKDLLDAEFYEMFCEQDAGTYWDDMDAENELHSEKEEALRKAKFEYIEGADNDSWEDCPVWVACHDGYLTVAEAQAYYDAIAALTDKINRKIEARQRKAQNKPVQVAKIEEEEEVAF